MQVLILTYTSSAWSLVIWLLTEQGWDLTHPSQLGRFRSSIQGEQRMHPIFPDWDFIHPRFFDWDFIHPRFSDWDLTQQALNTPHVCAAPIVRTLVFYIFVFIFSLRLDTMLS